MKKDLYSKIFASSDCLSQQLMIGYLKRTLSEHDTHKVEEHLVDCELCSEALDGLMLVNSESVLSSVSDDVKRVVHKKENKKRAVPIGIWLAAAASFAIIIASVFTVKTITNESNKQLAVHEAKTTVAKDSLRSQEQPLEKNQTVLTQSTEAATENDIPENSEKEISQIRTFKSAPVRPPLNSETSPENVNDMELIVAREDNSETVDAFSDKTTEEPAYSRNQSLKSNSSQEKSAPTEPAAGSLSEIRTISRSESVEKQKKISEQVAYVHDLKIINYSLNKEEDVLELPSNNTEAIFATPEEKLETRADIKDIEISYKEKIAPALEAYRQERYQVVISLLNNFLKENPSDLNAKFYSGMANHYLQNYSMSLDHLQSLIIRNDNTFYEEAKYYAALNYIELNESTKARKLLIEIINMNGFYKQRAGEKLKELN